MLLQGFKQEKRSLPQGGSKSSLVLTWLLLLSACSILPLPCLYWNREVWNTTLTWSRVLQQSTNTPTGWVSCKLSFNSFSSRSEGPRLSSYQRRGESLPLPRKGPHKKHSLTQIPGPLADSPGSGEVGPQCWQRGRRWAGC